MTGMNTSRMTQPQKTGFRPGTITLAMLTAGALMVAHSSKAQGARQPELPSPLCDSVQVPEDSVMAFHAYAIGVQVYQWNGASWVFIEPQAKLYADSGYRGLVGTHFRGPTWQSNSGSKVVGLRMASCAPDPNSIAWLKLSGMSSQGPGMFDGVDFIQRVNTVGGVAPSTPGTTSGEMASVPYTAEYFFYRARD